MAENMSRHTPSKSDVESKVAERLKRDVEQAESRMTAASEAAEQARHDLRNLDMSVKQAATAYRRLQDAEDKPAEVEGPTVDRSSSNLETKQLMLYGIYNRLSVARTEATFNMARANRAKLAVYVEASVAADVYRTYQTRLRRKDRRRRLVAWLRSILREHLQQIV